MDRFVGVSIKGDPDGGRWTLSHASHRFKKD